MRLIINATNLQRGGALQVVAELLEEWCEAYPEHDYHVFLSPQLDLHFPRSGFPENFSFYSFRRNPGGSVWSALTFHRELSRLEAQLCPDLVCTVFGPALWRPKSPHICGFANGYYLFDDADFIRDKVTAHFIRRIRYYLRRSLLLRQLRRESDACWVETAQARQRLLQVCKGPVHIIGNTYSRWLVPESGTVGQVCRRFLYISAWYPHKNMEILPEVIRLLQEQQVDCQILLTLPEQAFGRIFASGYPDGYVMNLGPVQGPQMLQAYRQADAVLMPSRLETFSAAYPEAMRMEKPVLASDLPFAREICGDAALYFDPCNASDIVACIIKLMQDKCLYAQLVQRGRERLALMETPVSRAARLMNYIQEMNPQHSQVLCAG